MGHGIWRTIEHIPHSQKKASSSIRNGIRRGERNRACLPKRNDEAISMHLHFFPHASRAFQFHRQTQFLCTLNHQQNPPCIKRQKLYAPETAVTFSSTFVRPSQETIIPQPGQHVQREDTNHVPSTAQPHPSSLWPSSNLSYPMRHS